MIQFKGVNKWFGKLHVLKDIDLQVAAGEVVVICGPSGSGKSTLIRCINRLEKFQKGELFVDGTPLHDHSTNLTKLRAEIGFVFQQFHLYPHMTALQNVILAPINVRKLKRTAAEELGREKLARVGLADKADSYPSQLSGGQQQRVAIARALANDPLMVLADEPTGNLDSTTGKEILGLLDELHRAGRTLVLVTHDDDVARRAGRIIRMRDGRIESDRRKGA